MEQWFHFLFQQHGYCCLANSVSNSGYAERPCALTLLWYLDRLDGRREVAPRRHSIPQQVKVVLQIFLERCNGLFVDTGCTLVCFHLFVCLKDELLGNSERFDFWLLYVHRIPPAYAVEQVTVVGNPAPLLCSHYGTSSLLRAGPPLGLHRYSRPCGSAAWTSPSR